MKNIKKFNELYFDKNSTDISKVYINRKDDIPFDITISGGDDNRFKIPNFKVETNGFEFRVVIPSVDEYINNKDLEIIDTNYIKSWDMIPDIKIKLDKWLNNTNHLLNDRKNIDILRLQWNTKNNGNDFVNKFDKTY